MNLTEWLQYIEKIHPRWMDLELSRILDLAEKLNLRHFDCPVITIAGTNGKGSCVAYLESIYGSAGYRVAAYISPHLLKFNERVRLPGAFATDEQLCEAFSFIESVRGNIPLTYFEFTTLAALWIFKNTPLDVLILEIGLGGRKDAVNVVENDVGLITSISLDHTQWLGNDRESIGREKAPIFRKKKLAVYGEDNIPSSVKAIAADLGTQLYCLDKDYHYSVKGNSWEWSSLIGNYQDLPLPKLALQNAAASLMVVQLLSQQRPVSVAAISQGLKNAFMPGRFQVVAGPVLTILDVAHNPASAEWLAQSLNVQECKGKTLAVIGMLADKDISQTIEPLREIVSQWFCGSLQCERGALAGDISQCLQAFGIKRCYDYDSIEEAYKGAVAQADPLIDRVIVFGSFFTVAAIMPLLTTLTDDSYGQFSAKNFRMVHCP